MYSRLVDTAIAEPTCCDLVEDARKGRALLLHRDGVVHVLVTEVLDRRRQVAEEDWQPIVSITSIMRDR